MPPFTRNDFAPIAEEMASNLALRHKTHIHIAFVYGSRNNLLGMGVNKVGSRSLGAGYSAMMIHAERAALKAVGDVRKLQGATLVVIRVGKTGDIKGSHPCPECTRHLEKCMRCYGLRRVYYS
jgi:hypothetical protein